ncbi:MAG TPA: hypothetical protein VFY78_06125 [Gammaproteobacteria bacterium]|nr:hypothetical protein [Gammaproteobacteria bacterium]
MINTAKVRSLNNSVDGIVAGWFAFQDRYRSIPGDMSPAQASAQIAAGITVGDAGPDGTVDTGAQAGALWLHLSRAGFISGTYSGAAAPGPAAAVYDCPTGICPDNRFGSGMEIIQSAVTFGVPASHTLYTGSGIPVGIVAELDRKIDDGVANTGTVRGGASNGSGGTCAVAAAYGLGEISDCGLAIRNL